MFGIGIGLLGKLALSHPRIEKFVTRYWKWMVGALVAVALVWGFLAWQGHVKKVAFNSGFSAAEEQYKVKQDKANAITAADQQFLDFTAQYFSGLAAQRVQAIELTVAPINERIKNETSKLIVYRTCLITDGVFDDLQAGRAAVDANLRASDPSHD